MMNTGSPIGEDDLQAYIDGKLTPDRQALVDAYLAGHPEVSARVTQQLADREALRVRLSEKFAEPIPARLRIANLQSNAALRRRGWYRSAMTACIFLGIGLTGGWWLKPEGVQINAARLSEAGFAANASDAYRTFVVEVAHPVEVGADDEAHLVTWLSKRSGRALTPPNLSAFGYKLLGGRVLPGGGAAAAQLMYEDDKGERLAVYLRAGQSAQTAFTFEEKNGVSSFVWVDQGFDFAVSASVDRAKLLPIATAIYQGMI
ncbi:anti-sigma factor [Agrobacterium tumefaciens]|nr:anti-sigma factor [Agrobacterium tumefaciens]HZG27872.1 anti-sigma factor [Ensifer sp.]